jgi:hypothetical protein
MVVNWRTIFKQKARLIDWSAAWEKILSAGDTEQGSRIGFEPTIRLRRINSPAAVSTKRAAGLQR